jgi:hypothetical protein
MGIDPAESRVCEDMESGVCEAPELRHDSSVSPPIDVCAMLAMLGSRMSWRGGLMLTGLAGVSCKRTSMWVEMFIAVGTGLWKPLLDDEDCSRGE